MEEDGNKESFFISVTCGLESAPLDQLLQLQLIVQGEEVPVHHGDHQEGEGVHNKLSPEESPEGASPS